MDNVKANIKNRAVLSGYLEHIYLNKALDDFFKSKAKIFPFYVNIENLEKHYEYSEYFTRTWLSFMDNEEFNKIVKLKMNNKIADTFENSFELEI